MSKPHDSPDLDNLPLPADWPSFVRSALIHTISLIERVYTIARARISRTGDPQVRQQVELDRRDDEIARLREQLRIKDSRWASIPLRQRPKYSSTARLAILELRAARGWSLSRTAREFDVSRNTIRAWIKRVDEDGPNALLQLQEPVNKYPDYARQAIRRIKTLCPNIGKQKLAQMFARAGLHIATSTVGRILKEKPTRPPESAKPQPKPPAKSVVAKHPNHVWHVDLTLIPTIGGFWVPWCPHAVLQLFPFCWWLALVLDNHSRRVLGFQIFQGQPTSEAIRAVLGQVIHASRAVPKYVVTDKGAQFWNHAFNRWCRRRSIIPRFGAVGQHGAIAVIERFIRTLKYSLLPGVLIPLNRAAMHETLRHQIDWYNEFRPHTTLDAAHPTKCTSAAFPRTASRALTLVPPGHGTLRAPPRRRSSLVNPAQSSTLTSSISTGNATSRSSHFNALRDP